MSIPNTNNGWGLQDVVNTVVPTTNDLIDCFADAISGNFDAEYSGSKTQLLNFRNYGSVPQPALYGYMYNGYAVTNANFAPSGWRVPTETDLLTLYNYLGTYTAAGGHLKEVGTLHWAAPNTGADNSSLFTLLPSGRRTSSTFVSLGIGGWLWTSTIRLSTQLMYYGAEYNTLVANWSTYYSSLPAVSIKDGFGCRLIKNDSTNPGTVTDYDGNVYDCVTIDTQVWTKQNWKCTKLNNGTLIPTVTGNTAWAALTTLAKCAYNNDENNV